MVSVLPLGILSSAAAQTSKKFRVPEVDPAQSIEWLYEAPEEPESEDEASPASKSDEPIIYVSDTENARIVVMQGLKGDGFTALGLAGYGQGRFLRPAQIWVDYSGRLYIADSGNDRIVRINQDGQASWDEVGGFSNPTGVAVDGSGVYIADTRADRVVVYDEVSSKGKQLEVLTHPKLKRPRNLWIDGAGSLYVCCGVDPPGGIVLKTWTEKERRRWEVYDGDGLSGSRFFPSSLVTHKGQIKLLDQNGRRIITMRDFSGNRKKELSFKRETRWRLSRPQGLAIDKTGQRFFVCDTGNDRLLEISSDGEVLQEFYGLEDDPSTLLRSPGSIFVYSSAPAPKPKEETDEEKKKKKK